MKLSLVVLAAGMGSRYGGLKQIDPVGPSGEVVLDYSVYDALRSGFERVVFVIRKEFEQLFRDSVGRRFEHQIEVSYVFQELTKLPGKYTPPAGREKPWGTGHAVWCAKDAVDGPFAVLNADDFYGLDAFRKLGGFLNTPRKVDEALACAMAGFKLSATLSEFGAVSRGVCEIDAEGRLHSVVERARIKKEAGRIFQEAPGGAELVFSGNETVSMNCWGFPAAIFPSLEIQLSAFLSAKSGDLKAEFYLPAAIDGLVKEGRATVAVLPTSGNWFGVTYREDRPHVVAAIQGLVKKGEYPERLWSIRTEN